MRNNCYFLWYCNYMPKLATHTHPHLHKIQPEAHHTHQHTHTILHTKILLHTHLHKIPHTAHHTPIQPRTVMNTNILMRRNFAHTRKLSTHKNCQNMQNCLGCIASYTKFQVGTTYPTIRGFQRWIWVSATWNHPGVPQLYLCSNILCLRTQIYQQRKVYTTKGHHLIC